MNRILFEREEVVDGGAVFGGERARHVLDILHGEIGQTIKTGVVDGPIGTSVITEIRGDAANPEIAVRSVHDAEAEPTWIDLVLAPPRPRVMKRLLPQLAAMGVGRIVLVGAKKVEKDFWGATLLKVENYRPLLIDGLMQAGTTELPRIELRRNFRRFVEDELEAMFPGSRRLVAHPYGVASAENAATASGRPLLAIGPEGGWTDGEVELLEAHGFSRFTLGSRILRTDTALIAAIAVANLEATSPIARGCVSSTHR